MESDMHDSDLKTAFRKPSSESANRKYRRRSPINGSSSTEGSPQHNNSSSPAVLRDETTEDSQHQSKSKDSKKDRDRDSYRNSKQQSSRSVHSYSRPDDYVRRDKHGDEDDRAYDRMCSGRVSRDNCNSDNARQESERGRSRGYSQHTDRYSRDKYDDSRHGSKDKEKGLSGLEHKKYKDQALIFDRAGSGRRHGNSISEEKDRHRDSRDHREEIRDHHRTSKDYKGDHKASFQDFRGGWDNSSHGRSNDEYRRKESYKHGQKETESQKAAKGGKKYDDWESDQEKEQLPEGKASSFSENQKSHAKKPRLFSLAVDEEQSNSEKALESGGENKGKSLGDENNVANDLNAAKIAALKAAELVNRNLAGAGGCMTAEQKKKLLWGNKKSTAAEESGHRWDTALFGDRERQEKFNKLMGVKGEPKPPQKSDSQDAEKQRELQMDLEKQYTAGLRRRDGRTVGLGL